MRSITAVFCLSLLFVPLYAHGLCVKASVANVRSGPGQHYEKIWQVDRFMPLEKVGVSLSGDWYAVRDVDGDVLWIHESLVTVEYRCAVVKSKVVNVRTGPGTRYRKRFSEPANKYDSFRVIRESGGWVEVRDAHNKPGWIHRDYLWIQ